MNPTVQTVLGPVEPSELGRTLVHEHLLIGWPGWHLDHRHRFDRTAALRRCTEICSRLIERGIRTIVDPCPIDLGRDAEFAAEVSSGSGLQIVCATGLYTEAAGQPFYFRERSIDELTDLFTAELVDGIGDSGIRAGIIKCAAGATAGVSTSIEVMTPGEERAHRAAARASLATGAAIYTHTDESNPAGLAQVRILQEEGVDPARAIIGHCGGNGDLRYLLSLLKAGASIGFDRCGVETVAPDQQRIAALIGLLRTGWAERLFLSSDAPMWWLGAPSPVISRVLDRNPNWHAQHILDGIVPTLLAGGVNDDEIRLLLEANPRRWLTPTQG